MFDELLNPPPSGVNQAPEAIVPIVEVIPPVNADLTGSPSSTMVDQDAPSTSNSTTPTKKQSSVIPQDIGDDNLDMEVAHMRSDPLVEAVATACFTQNRSIIRLRHGKTLYELLHIKLPDLSFFYVFGALCYPTNDSENLGPALNEMTPGTISSRLVPTTSPSTSYVPPSRDDWDLLFQPMFDELLNPSPSVVNQAHEAIDPIVEVIPPVNADSIGLPSLTTVEQDAPSTSNSPTPIETQSSVIPQDVGEDNLDMEVAHMGNDLLFGVPIPKVTSAQSIKPASPQAIVQTNHPMPHHNSKWTKDHP
nr:integrase, catalytic region, zinc finger, CCHC-type, peptidase aspartic, catalytic [Tanacetum cinerariifolium]